MNVVKVVLLERVEQGGHAGNVKLGSTVAKVVHLLARIVLLVNGKIGQGLLHVRHVGVVNIKV